MAYGIVWNTIYLGNHVDIDSDESVTFLDNPGVLVGQTFGSSADPLHQKVVDIVTDSADSTMWRDNSANGNGDTLTYDVGAGSITSQLDMMHNFNATVTFADGSTETGTIYVLQDTVGNVFVTTMSTIDVTSAGVESIEFVSAWSGGSDGFAQVGPTSRSFLCLLPGTLISTPGGQKPIEMLRVGDRVDTFDAGPQPILWMAMRHEKPHSPRGEHPIRIPVNAMGPGRPAAPLDMSPMHCVMLCHEAIQQIKGHSQAFVRAGHLAGRKGIRELRGRRNVTYVTLLLAQHQAICANGVWVESLYPGKNFVGKLSGIQKVRLLAAFPEIDLTRPDWYGPPSRQVLTAEQAFTLPKEAMCFEAVDRGRSWTGQGSFTSEG